MHKLEVKVLVINMGEPVFVSWLRDAGTFALFAALIGIGIWQESSAMQWSGLIIGFVSVAGWIAATRTGTLSIEEAEKELQQLKEKRDGKTSHYL